MIFFFKEYSYKITRIFWLVSHASRWYTHEIHNIFRNVRELKCVAYTQKFRFYNYLMYQNNYKIFWILKKLADYFVGAVCIFIGQWQWRDLRHVDSKGWLLQRNIDGTLTYNTTLPFRMFMSNVFVVLPSELEYSREKWCYAKSQNKLMWREFV